MGRGSWHNDAFADPRLLDMPLSTCALLVFFNRNHNVSASSWTLDKQIIIMLGVAQKIYDINERGKYHNPTGLSDAARKAQDDEIFHRSRLVNCGLFMRIILGDYIDAIPVLVQDYLEWRLDPLKVSDRGLKFVTFY
jgi:hypothetical protein